MQCSTVKYGSVKCIFVLCSEGKYIVMKCVSVYKEPVLVNSRIHPSGQASPSYKKCLEYNKVLILLYNWLLEENTNSIISCYLAHLLGLTPKHFAPFYAVFLSLCFKCQFFVQGSHQLNCKKSWTYLGHIFDIS